MRVGILLKEELHSDQLVIMCQKTDDRILDIKKYAEEVDGDKRIMVKSGTEMVRVNPNDIYYIESVDKRTFIYLLDGYYESGLRLYELEERLMEKSFFRASKSVIVNIRHIEKISMMINRNLMLTLENKEKVIVSRRNVKAFNQKIGME